MNVKELIGARIKELRLKNNLTQSQLAEKVDIATKHQSCIETGKNFPSAELLERYAEIFNIEVSNLLQLTSYTLDEPRKDIIERIMNTINMSSDYELDIINKFLNSFIEK